jgi:hypothetical protein
MAAVLTATLDTASTPYRVVLTITGATGVTSASIVCNESTGARPVRGADPVVVSGGGAVAFEYEAPRDVVLTWTATPNSGSPFSSAAVTVPSDNLVLLLHPGAPATSVYINGDPIVDSSYDMQSSVFNPPGRAEAVYWSTGSNSATGTLMAWTATFADTSNLVNLLRSGFPLRLLAPAAFTSSSPYLGITSVKVSRATRNAWDQTRYVTAEYQVSARPISSLQLLWTYTQLNGTYATYAAMTTAYSGKTYIDVSIGPA